MNKKNLRRIVVLAVLAGLIIAAFILPVRAWLESVLKWVEDIGYIGVAVVVAIYIIATPLFFPGSVLTLGAGFLFGVILGTITVSIGSTLGACAAFLLGRTIARDWIAAKVSQNKKFEAIDLAVGDQGLKIVLLTRLSPIFPLNLLNYGFGLTKVDFWKYALGSWLGMLPGTVMYVYFGAGLRSITEAAAGEVETGIAGRVFFWIGLVLFIGITLFITRIAQNALEQHVPEAQLSEGEVSEKS
jgi:uncharacterized membrane protein YdjX (TVP38/TMEM64 family)